MSCERLEYFIEKKRTDLSSYFYKYVAGLWRRGRPCACGGLRALSLFFRWCFFYPEAVAEGEAVVAALGGLRAVLVGGRREQPRWVVRKEGEGVPVLPKHKNNANTRVYK